MTYEEKLALVAPHEKNRQLMANLMRRKNEEKVEYLIRKYGLNKQPATTPANHPTATTPALRPPLLKKEGKLEEPPATSDKLRVIRSGRQVNYDELPPELKRRWDENRDNYKLIRSLHEKLKLMHKAPDTMREPLCLEIISRDNKNRDNWKVIDEWDGTYPEESVKAAESSRQLDFKRINSNRKYITENRERAITDPVFRAKVQERYNELKAAGIDMKPETLAELKAAGIDI